MSRFSRFAPLGALLGLLSMGCAFVRKPEVPMRAELHPHSSEQKAKHLVLFLPGLLDEPADVVAGGFLEEMKGAPQFDSVIADAHFGYYRSGQVIERLERDVVDPVRAQYDEFWIVGVSMGGYGATAYAERHPEDVTGVILIAPYLGRRKIIRDVEKSGNLRTWNGSKFEDKSDRTRHEARLWQWFQERPSHPDAPIVYLTSGQSDRHMRSLELIQPVLPRERVRTIPGGHDWEVWRPLFASVVEDELSKR